jgi:hypothetical protein
MEGIFQLQLAGWAEFWADPACLAEGVTKPQPGVNYSTFNHLGETGSKLKLSAVPEKSFGPKN